MLFKAFSVLPTDTHHLVKYKFYCGFLFCQAYYKPWCLWSNWIDEEEEDIGGGHDELEGEPVVVDVANEDGVEETNSKRNLGKCCHEGSLLWTSPLEEDGEADDVGADTSGSDDHVGDGEHEVVNREGGDNLSTEMMKQLCILEADREFIHHDNCSSNSDGGYSSNEVRHTAKN